MSYSIDRRRYVDLFGPTTGDLVRLADTALSIRVERDLTVPGDELKFGGGKSVRDDQGQTPGVGDDVALDLVITGALIVDVTGIYKADIGVKHGRIVGIGKAGNPHRMVGVDPRLIVGVTTEVIAAEGCLVTAGAIDSHIHFICPQQTDEALASGVTTFVGGGTGPATGTKATTCTPGAWNLARMLQGTDDIPLNIGFTGKGNSSQPEGLGEQIRAGCIGLKLHEDWGTTPRTIKTALDVADAEDIQITLHTDTLNESAYVDETIAAFGGRTIHSYHSEGAGGGHAPDIIKICGVENVLPSSTNPTRPFTRNTLDEHLDMLMVCHHLSAKIPEDVAFAESRIRGETIAAEDILHDLGAISMMSSDSQAMGRVGEVITRTIQTAHKMRVQRGSLPEDTDGADNFRVKRYVAKFTINPAIAHGFGHEVGSIEVGKLADLCLWKPAMFGVRPELVLKGGFIAWSQMGDANASIPPCQPYVMRPMFGARGRAASATSLLFLSRRALAEGTTDGLGLHKIRSAVRDVRNIGKRDMRLNDALPRIEVDPETYEVRADGVHLTCEPLDVLPLAQRFSLFLQRKSRPKPRLDPLLLLQLADSAFPTGGFAHSAGLEAALGHGYLRSPDDLRRALEALLWTTGTLSLPYVRATFRDPARAVHLARRCETQLTIPATNRASRAQGRAFVDALGRTVAEAWATKLRDDLRTAQTEPHLAPVFGAALATLGATEAETTRLFVFTTLRSAIGAAVRLNVAGPFEGQRLQASLAAVANDVLVRTHDLDVDDAASASPFWEIAAGTHDRLRTRLFQS